MHSTFGPRVTRLGSLLLAAVATFGVAMPRARVTARERVGRAVAIRLASPRINDRLGWVAPDPTLVVSTNVVTGLSAPSFDGRSSAAHQTPRVDLAAPVAASTARAVAPAPHPASAALRAFSFARPPPLA